MELIKNLEWRYATKKFDTEKKVSDENIQKIKKAVQLSASSFGLQLYKVLIIENQELKEKLKYVSWNQSQITDASHLFVFCNYVKITDDLIDDFMNLLAEKRGDDSGTLKSYGDFVKQMLRKKSDDENQIWTSKQVYITLANLLNACAELKIDACPMEGFDSDKYNQILELSDQNLNATVVASVGYRYVNDDYQNLPKVRKPFDSLFKTI